MTQPQLLTKPLYGEKHIACFYKDAKRKDQVTPSGIVYFYINGDSKQFRTIILFKEPRHTNHDMTEAMKEVKKIDPELMSVKFINYARPNSLRVVK